MVKLQARDLAAVSVSVGVPLDSDNQITDTVSTNIQMKNAQQCRLYELKAAYSATSDCFP